ncbi:MAG TPA: hypothetical protein VGK52_18385 [Polyangia bacterium]|jgi:hypothetical protein
MRNLLTIFAFVGFVSAASEGPGVAAPRVQTVELACHEVPDAESSLAVLVSPDDVVRVDELKAKDHLEDPTVPLGEGASITIAAQPFVTSVWLQAAIDCHRAHNAVSRQPAIASRSPLDVTGTKITVSAQPGTLTINIATADHQAAREVIARARALLPAR